MDTLITCDFDGTITNVDVIDTILYEVIGKTDTDFLNDMHSKNIISIHPYLNKLSNISDTQLKELLEIVIAKHNIKIDPTFLQFALWCTANSIELYILSHGIKKVINHFIKTFDEKNIFAHDLINGQVVYNEQIIPKNNFVKNIQKRLIHIGDGNSDFSMIGKCDILFAKHASTLETKCIYDNAKYVPYETFDDIKKHLTTLKNIYL